MAQSTSKIAAWMGGLLWGVALLGCGFLYRPFRDQNPNNCNNAPEICAADEQCNADTGYCVKRPVDLADPPDMADAVDMTPAGPTISAVTPRAGVNNAATPVTITGTGFRSGATVTVGGLPCSSVVVNSATSISCSAPPLVGACNRVPVVVTHPDTMTSATLANGFTYRSSAPFSAATQTGMMLGRAEVVRLADFNGDNNPDTVIGPESSNQLDVRLGSGSNVFGPSSGFSLGMGVSSPIDIRIADINNYGKLDLIAGSSTGNGLSYLAGNGMGGFTLVNKITVGNTPVGVFAADLNNDNQLDVVVANGGSSSVSVLLNNGMGSLVKQMPDTAVAANPRYIAVADMDGDGVGDIVVTHAPGTGPSILIGNGDGTFKTPTILTNALGNTGYVQLGDYNGDNKQDILVTFLAAQRMAFLPGLGNGTFGAQALSVTTMAPNWVDVGDLDRDGLVDIVVANRLSNNVTIYYGGASATAPFPATADATIATGNQPTSLAIADINQDGFPDLAIAMREANAASSYIDVRLGQCM